MECTVSILHHFLASAADCCYDPTQPIQLGFQSSIQGQNIIDPEKNNANPTRPPPSRPEFRDQLAVSNRSSQISQNKESPKAIFDEIFEEDILEGNDIEEF